MYSLEYFASKGRASTHLYHRNIVDFYLILKDNKRVFSEKFEWTDYCLMLEVDNLNKRIYIKKSFFISSKQEVSCYDCRTSDYWTIREELEVFINQMKEALEIIDYKIFI